jgi:hypothetical protein
MTSTATRKQQAINFTLEHMEDSLCREAELDLYQGRARTERERDLLRALASFNREIYRVEFHTLQLWHSLPERFFDRFPDDFFDQLDNLNELGAPA